MCSVEVENKKKKTGEKIAERTKYKVFGFTQRKWSLLKKKGSIENKKLYRRLGVYIISIPFFLILFSFILKGLVNTFKDFTNFIVGYELVFILYFQLFILQKNSY